MFTSPYNLRQSLIEVMSVSVPMTIITVEAAKWRASKIVSLQLYGCIW